MKHISTIAVVFLFAVLLVGCDKENTKTQCSKDLFIEWTSDIDLLLSHIVEPTFHFNEWYTADVSPINPPNPALYEYFQMTSGHWLPVSFSEISPDTWKIVYKDSLTSMLFHHVYGAYAYASGGSWETLLSDPLESTNPFIDHTFRLEKPADNDYVTVRCDDSDCQLDCYLKASYLYYSILWNSAINLEGRGTYMHIDEATGAPVRVNFDIIEPIVLEVWNHDNQSADHLWASWWVTTTKAGLNFYSGKVRLSTKNENGETVSATVTIIDERHIVVQMGNIKQEWEL